MKKSNSLRFELLLFCIVIMISFSSLAYAFSGDAPGGNDGGPGDSGGPGDNDGGSGSDDDGPSSPTAPGGVEEGPSSPEAPGGVVPLEEELISEPEPITVNQAPTLSIPDQNVKATGFIDNLVDLFQHAADDLTATANLIFSLIAQTSTNLISCSLDSNRFIDCVTQLNQDGFSDVTVSVQDEGGLTTFDTFRINVREVEVQPSDIKNIYIGGIAFDNEFPSPGDELTIFLNFENQGSEDLRDVRVTAIIQDLGVRSRTLSVDVRDNDGASRTLMLEIPSSAETRRYWVEVVIDFDGDRRVKYRPIDVV